MNTSINKRKSFDQEAEEAIANTAALIASIKPLLSEEQLKDTLKGRIYLMANFDSLLRDAAELAPSLMTPDIKKKRVAAELCRKSVMQTLEKKKEIKLSANPMSSQRQDQVKDILKGNLTTEKATD